MQNQTGLAQNPLQRKDDWVPIFAQNGHYDEKTANDLAILIEIYTPEKLVGWSGVA